MENSTRTWQSELIDGLAVSHQFHCPAGGIFGAGIGLIICDLELFLNFLCPCSLTWRGPMPHGLPKKSQSINLRCLMTSEICPHCWELVKVYALNHGASQYRFCLDASCLERIIPSDFAKPRTSRGCRDIISLGELFLVRALASHYCLKAEGRFRTNRQLDRLNPKDSC